MVVERRAAPGWPRGTRLSSSTNTSSNAATVGPGPAPHARMRLRVDCHSAARGVASVVGVVDVCSGCGGAATAAGRRTTTMLPAAEGVACVLQLYHISNCMSLSAPAVRTVAPVSVPRGDARAVTIVVEPSLSGSVQLATPSSAPAVIAACPRAWSLWMDWTCNFSFVGCATLSVAETGSAAPAGAAERILSTGNGGESAPVALARTRSSRSCSSLLAVCCP